MPTQFRKRYVVGRYVQNQPLMLERAYEGRTDAMKYAAEIPRGVVLEMFEHVEGFGDGDDMESYVNVDTELDAFDTAATADEGTPPGRFARQAQAEAERGDKPRGDRAATGAGGGPRITSGTATPVTARNQTTEQKDESVKDAEALAKKDDAARKENTVELDSAKATAKDADKLNVEKEQAPSARRKVVP